MKIVNEACGSMARTRFAAAPCVALLWLMSACSVAPSRAPTPAPESTTVPPATEQPGSAEPEPAVPVPPAPPPRTFRLGTAASSLIAQARTLTAKGDFALAAQSVERALRIEPDNPLVWIELAKVRLAAGDEDQAENLAQRALALAAGAPREQSSAWRLIAQARLAAGDNIGAREAGAKAERSSPQR